MRFWRLTKLPMTHLSARLPDYADQRRVIEFLASNKKIEDFTLVTKFKVKLSKVELRGFDVELFEPLVDQKRLKSFTAHSFMCFNENNLIFLLKIKSLEQIRVFNYQNIRGRRNISKWSCEASNLKHIQIYCRPSKLFDDERRLSASTLIKIGQATSKLEYLRFDGTLFDRQHVGIVFRQNQLSLKYVHLPFVYCSEDDLQDIVQCFKLKGLSLLFCFSHLSKESFLRIPENKKLKTLCLRFVFGGQMSPVVLTHFFSHHNLSELTFLHMESADARIFSDEVLKSIAMLKNLSYLKLTQHENHKERLEGIFHVLKQCKKLETLILEVCFEFVILDFEEIFILNMPRLKYLKLECWDFQLDLQLEYCGYKLTIPIDVIITSCLQHSDTIKAVIFGEGVLYFKPEEGGSVFECYSHNERKPAMRLFNHFPGFPKIYNYHDIMGSRKVALKELADIDGFLGGGPWRGISEQSSPSTFNNIKKFFFNRMSAWL